MDNNDDGGSYLALYGADLLRQGYPILPIKAGLKHPGKKNWQSMPSDSEHLARWLANGYADGGVGIRCGDISAVDIDIRDPELSEQLAEEAIARLGWAPARVGEAPKQALVYRADTPFRKVASRVFVDWEGREHKLEVLGQGQQLVAYHTHPVTGRPYTWAGDGLVSVRADSLNVITHADALWLVERAEALMADAGMEPKPGSAQSGTAPDTFDDPDEAFLANAAPRAGWSPDDARSRLRYISADDRDTWIKVGMALHHEFAGSDEGFGLWDEWSQTSASYGGVDWSRWAGFEADLTRGRPVTGKTITALAKAGRAAQRGQQTPGDGFNVAWWGDVTAEEEPPRQLVEELLAYQQASLVVAQANTGKSVLSLDLAICVASGTPWRDRLVEQGGVLYIAAESPETIRARTLAERRARGITGALPIAIVQDPITLTTEEQREAFAEAVATWMARYPNTNLITLDTFRNATPGLAENDAEAVGPVVRLCHDLARRHNVHFQIDHHTTKAGNGYAGSGAFGAIVDTEILITRGEDDMEGLLCAEVLQQRGLNSRGDKYWYSIRGEQTGRATNFGKPETAPVIDRHWSDADLDFRKVEVAEARDEEARAAMDRDLDRVVAAMAAGHTSRDALMAAAGVSQRRLVEVRNRGVEEGVLVAKGEGGARRFYLAKEGGV